MRIQRSLLTWALFAGLLTGAGMVLLGFTPTASAEGDAGPEQMVAAFSGVLGVDAGPLGWAPIFISKTGQGRIRINGTVYTLPYSDLFANTGETYTLEPVPDARWAFSDWSGDVTGNANPLLLYLDGPKTFTVNFVQTECILSLTLESGSGRVKVNGTSRGLPWSETFAPGSTVNLEAVPDDGWVFGSWLGDLTGGATPTDLTMDADKTVRLQFNGGPIYVDKDNVSGTQDGLSWATAFTRIQMGINTAAAPDHTEVWVAEGVYDEVRDNQTGSVMLKPDVAVYGGFAGTETTRDQRDWAAHITVIDGSTAYGGEPAHHVVFINEPGEFTFDGFSVTGGVANGGCGGGLAIAPTAVAVDPVANVANCRFYANTAVWGGGLYAESFGPQVVTLWVNNCEFHANSAEDSGGGVYFNRRYGGDSSWAHLDRCVFTSNQAAKGGGGLSSGFSGLVLNDCRFSDNKADGGGGLACDNERVSATGCCFEDNHASGMGGGACMNAEILELRKCTIRRNLLTQTSNTYASGSGLHVKDFAGHLDAVIDSCIFEDNGFYINENGGLGVRGGGLLVDWESIDDNMTLITNCIFRANGGVSGSGALAYAHGAAICTGGWNGWTNPRINVVNSVFYGHHLPGCSECAGGVVWQEGQDGEVSVVNSILWDNSAPVDPSFGGPGSVSVTYSDVQDGYAGDGNINLSPRFRDADNGDFRLRSNSPCIDAGTSDGAPPVDYLDVPRPQNDLWDMGAYEYVPSAWALNLYKEGAGQVEVNGTLEDTPWTGWFPPGTVVTLRAVPALNWKFVQWEEDLDGSANPTEITMSGNRLVIADFNFKYDFGPMRTIYYPKWHPTWWEDVTVRMTNDGGPLSQLRLREHIPAGWSFVSVVSPNPPAVVPTPGATDTLDFIWRDVPAFPATLTYRVLAPAGQSGKKTFTGEVLFHRGPVETTPELEVAVGGISSVIQRVYHSLDYQGPDYRIALPELLRLIQFYNSGGYHADPSTNDHYGPGPGPQDGAPHDSDARNQDWQISLSELLRAIQFYNVGGYHVADGTEDGFAPGL